MKHSEKVLSVTLIPHDQGAENSGFRQIISRFSSADGIASTTFVLYFAPSVATVRGNYFNAVMSELDVKLV